MAAGIRSENGKRCHVAEPAVGRRLLGVVVDVLGTALGVAPFAEEAIRGIVGKNAHANLIKLVERDLRRSQLVASAHRESLARAWSSQRVDPQLGGQLVAWLATGKEEHLVAVGTIWSALLTGIVDDPGLDIDEVVGVTLDSARRHLSRAQASDRDALHVEAGSIKDHITRGLSALSAVHPAAVGRVRFNLPDVAASFTGREEELDALERSLSRGGRAIVTQAIAGLGGVGKSQLAAYYVAQHVDEYDVVAWIAAEDGGIGDLAMLAARLGLAPVSVSPDDRARTALGWLARL